MKKPDVLIPFCWIIFAAVMLGLHFRSVLLGCGIIFGLGAIILVIVAAAEFLAKELRDAVKERTP